MTKQQVRKAQELLCDIERCEMQIGKISHYQSENFAPRETYLKITGMENDIIVPESLFRVITKLVLSEYNTKLIELKKEFEAI
jgi:hypothetical protein